MNTNCKICGRSTSKIFNARILKKYNTNYYQCEGCGFIGTEEPYWLEEAYDNAITKLDIGLIWRNLHFSGIVEHIVKENFDPYAKFIDYGGGYGMFVRLMRDKGFDFYRQDIYCSNLFAEFFDVTDLPGETTFEVLTAFEVFEHLTNPAEELERMLAYSENIIFSTELQPTAHPTPESWWYFIPETGQHISLYSYQSLKELAGKYKLNFYSDNKGLHIFSKKALKEDPFHKKAKKGLWHRKKQKPVELESLLMKDFDFVRKKINL